MAFTHVLVVDDEPLARERLAALLHDCENMEVVGEAGTGKEAVDLAQSLKPEIVLMDIRMPGMDGIEAAHYLNELEAPPSVIFCTAYDDHALAAFEANAVDYVVKPIRLERLKTALERARRFNGNTLQKLAEAASAQGKKRTHICARVRGNIVLIAINDIQYLLAEDKYVIVHHAKGEVLVEESLKHLEEEFSDRFVRIHRNCLISLNSLVGLKKVHDGRLLAELTGVTTELEVSRRNIPAVRKLARLL